MGEREASVKVHIMQRTVEVACGAGERQNVVAAAAHLEQQMRAIMKGSQLLGLERCAILAGLNVCHELLTLRAAEAESNSEHPQVNSRLEALKAQVDSAVRQLQNPQN